MDLVNSVTQNSNNNETKMENQGDSNNNNNCKPKLMSSSGDKGDGSSEQLHQRPMGLLDTHDELTLSLSSSAMSGSADVVAAAIDSNQGVPKKAQVPNYLKAIGMDPKKFWPKKYRFTREKSPGQYNPMTIAQRNFYETNGYIVIDDCAPKKLVETIRTQHKQSALVNEFLVDKLVAKNGKLLQYAKCFCDDRLMLMTHRLIECFQSNETAKEVMDNKQASRQQLYRDWVYLPFRPIDRICCAVTAIEALDHVILVVPGTHRVGQVTISSTLENISAAYDTSQEKTVQLKEFFETSPEKISSLVDKSQKGFKYVNLKPCQTLFYHPGLIHGFSNDLVNFRRSQLASIAYYAAADCEYIDLRGSFKSATMDCELPISLAHFGDKNPQDYTSWIDKPILLSDKKANL